MKLVGALLGLFALAPLGLLMCAFLGHWWYFPILLAVALGWQWYRERDRPLVIPWPPSGHYDYPAPPIEGGRRLPDGRECTYGPGGTNIHDPIHDLDEPPPFL